MGKVTLHGAEPFEIRLAGEELWVVVMVPGMMASRGQIHTSISSPTVQ